MRRCIAISAVLLLALTACGEQGAEVEEVRLAPEDYLRQILVERSNLVDPYSAEFRNLRYIPAGPAGVERWCGEFNAKNRMGGYTGWDWFVLYVDSPQYGTALIKLESALDGKSRCRGLRPAPEQVASH